MKKLKEITEIKEKVLPETFNVEIIEINGNLGLLAIEKPWIDVTTYSWMSENPDEYRQGLRPKILGPIRVTLHAFSQIDNTEKHEFISNDFEPIFLNVYGNSLFYECSVVL